MEDPSQERKFSQNSTKMIQNGTKMNENGAKMEPSGKHQSGWETPPKSENVNKIRVCWQSPGGYWGSLRTFSCSPGH